jgi:hypothetical protein
MGLCTQQGSSEPGCFVYVHEINVADGSYPSVNVFRLGKKEPKKTRMIKVEFDSTSEVEMILKNAQKLIVNNKFKTVYYLSPDRTKEQRLTHSKLVKQMRDMISRDSYKHYFIIITKTFGVFLPIRRSFCFESQQLIRSVTI